jgi:serine/threonine protein kinase
MGEASMGSGTPGYLPPEHNFSEAPASSKSDVFALGQTFLRLLSHKMRFTYDE